MKKFFLSIVAFCAIALATNNVAYAQLQVFAGSTLPTGWTADSLVQNVLLGEGVTVTNVTFNGSTGVLNCTSIGMFSTGTNPTNIGMEEGIILGSGNVTMAIGPNNATGQSNSTNICPSYPDDDLAALISQTENDVAVLEFDFVPRSDSIKFEYVFASEEYPEFVCNINDVFGFFISGINPNGGMYTNNNIALIPGTTLPITINNVNDGNHTATATCPTQYSNYYVDNANGTTIQYDGFTTVLTACASVVPCTPYHLKICIADASDNILDSGVFLKKGSLSSNGITPRFINPANPHAPDTLFEGCCATVLLERQHAKSAPEAVGFNFTGTASNGGDFVEFNSNYYFPADSLVFRMNICPLMDGVTEGDETVCLMLSPASGCPNQDTINFVIRDAIPIELTATHDSLTSQSIQCHLYAQVTGGMPNRTVTWTNLTTHAVRTGEDVIVNSLPAAYYQCVVQDSCYNIDMDTIFVGIIRDFAHPTLNDTLACAGSPLTLGIRGADSCVWFFNDRDPFNTHDSIIVDHPTTSGTYYIKSFKWWQDQWWEDYDSIHVQIVPLPEMHITTNLDEICEGESVIITGTGCGTYSWDGGTHYSDANTHTYVLDTTTMLVIYGMTNAGNCPGMDSVLITVDTVPDIEISAGAGICNGEAVSLSVTTSTDDFTWSSQPEDPTLAPQAHLTTINVNPAQTTVYTVNAHVGVCSNSGSQTVAVEPMPQAIGEVDPQVVELGKMEATFSDHSLNATTRTWILPDGSTDDRPQFTYLVSNEEDSVSMTLIAFNPYMCSDTTVVTVLVDHTTLWAPNAFVPDESANNHFEVKMNDIRDYHIRIFDRNGQLVFESMDPNQYWDGTNLQGVKCPQGSYVYFIIAHKIFYPYEQINRTGTVTIIR